MAKVADVIVRSALSEWLRPHSRDFDTDVSGESMTKQSFKDECDINTIVRRFTETGEWPEAALPPQFGDLTGFDFREAMDLVNAAQASFDNLPAHIRKRFANSPEEFVDFCSDEANAEEMMVLGLRKRPEASDVEGEGEVGAPPVKAPGKAVSAKPGAKEKPDVAGEG